MASATFPIPNFSKTVPDVGGGSQMTTPMQGTFGGMSSTQNQYMNFPSMVGDGGPSNTFDLSGYFPSSGPYYGGSPISGYPMPTYQAPGPAQTAYPPGTVPPQGSPTAGTMHPGFTIDPHIGTKGNLGRAGITTPTVDPGFTQMVDAFLRSQLGQGVSPFNLSAILPSTGDVTGAGQLTAPENPLLQSLQEFYTTGQGGPLPGVLPMWQSAMKSMEIPIQKQQANIEEAFGARGALGSSEMAQALETYGAQTAADQEALLGQLTLQALPQEQAMASGLQNMDQASIDRLVQEYIRTSPEYNPLMQDFMGFASLYPPTAGKGPGFMGAFSQALGQSLGSFGLNMSGGGGQPLSFGASMGGG